MVRALLISLALATVAGLAHAASIEVPLPGALRAAPPSPRPPIPALKLPRDGPSQEDSVFDYLDDSWRPALGEIVIVPEIQESEQKAISDPSSGLQ